MTKSENGQGDEEALKARLDRLAKALEERERRPTARSGEVDVSARSTGRALSLGMRVLSEFTAGIIAGALLGWLLDKLFSTSPAFLIVFIGLGTATGFWNVYRLAVGSTGAPRNGSQ